MNLHYSIYPSKYYVEEPWEWELTQEYHITKEFDNGFHYLVKKEGKWYIGAHKGCRWDGATNWFDTRIILKGSLGHDILHWLIRDGVILEEDNNKIDKELEAIILASNPDYPIWKGGYPILKVRARLIRRGTNLVNQKAGEERKIYVI